MNWKDVKTLQAISGSIVTIGLYLLISMLFDGTLALAIWMIASPIAAYFTVKGWKGFKYDLNRIKKRVGA